MGAIDELAGLVAAYEPNGALSAPEAYRRVEQFVDGLPTQDPQVVTEGLATWLAPWFLTKEKARHDLARWLEDEFFQGSTIYQFRQRTLAGARFSTRDAGGVSEGLMVELLDDLLRTGRHALQRARERPSGPVTLWFLDDVAYTGQTVFKRTSDHLEELRHRGITVMAAKAFTLVRHEGHTGARTAQNLSKASGLPVTFGSATDVPRTARVWASHDELLEFAIEYFDQPYFEEQAGVDVAPFATAEERRATTIALLRAGVEQMPLVEKMNGRRPHDRPLGTTFKAFKGPGFGSPVVTWRNCANNVPVALWAGPLALFPRVSAHSRASGG